MLLQYGHESSTREQLLKGHAELHRILTESILDPGNDYEYENCLHDLNSFKRKLTEATAST